MIQTLSEIRNLINTTNKKKLAVIAAQDDHVLLAVKDVYCEGLVAPVLIGDRRKITTIADEINFDLSNIEILDELDHEKCTNLAVQLVNEGRVHAVMKGALQTAEIMRVVLDKERGLRTGRLISCLYVIEDRNYSKLLFVTDPAINIAPDLAQKADIIRNAVSMLHKLGIECPKVAVLSAIESVNPAMPCTIDAAALAVMGRRGQIQGCKIDGPLSLDLAISEESKRHKGVKSDVAGDADLLVAPDIQSANILVKTISILERQKSCTVLLGTKAPVILTSRADSRDSKYYSILMALAV